MPINLSASPGRGQALVVRPRHWNSMCLGEWCQSLSPQGRAGRRGGTWNVELGTGKGWWSNALKNGNSICSGNTRTSDDDMNASAKKGEITTKGYTTSPRASRGWLKRASAMDDGAQQLPQRPCKAVRLPFNPVNSFNSLPSHSG
jgi:hypothetical protein